MKNWWVPNWWVIHRNRTIHYIEIIISRILSVPNRRTSKRNFGSPKQIPERAITIRVSVIHEFVLLRCIVDFREKHWKDFSLLRSLDLFSFWNSIIATNFQASQASGTFQNRSQRTEFVQCRCIIEPNWKLTKENNVNFLDLLKAMNMNQLLFFIAAHQVQMLILMN